MGSKEDSLRCLALYTLISPVIEASHFPLLCSAEALCIYNSFQWLNEIDGAVLGSNHITRHFIYPYL
jgi:hypothetical protein